MTTKKSTQDEDDDSLKLAKDRFWGEDLIALTSYPRSGNTLLRGVIENVTNTITGSDARKDRTLVKQLLEMGLKGEGCVDGTKVWVVKTHFPERVGRVSFSATRAILLVRNPFDAISSNFHMLLTQSHTQSVVDEDVNQVFNDVWKGWVMEECAVWKKFHEHWRQIPNTLVLRFEDLVLNPIVELPRLVSFLYSEILEKMPNLMDNLKQRLEEILQKPLSENSFYAARDVPQPSTSPPCSPESTLSLNISNPKLRRDPNEHSKLSHSTEGPYLRSLRFYSDEQYRFLLGSLRSELVEFGYWDSVLQARPEAVPPFLVPWVDHAIGACIQFVSTSSSEPNTTTSNSLANSSTRKEKIIIKLNNFWSIRPRTEEDPYGRGLDLRWSAILASKPAPRIKPRKIG